MGNRRVRSYRDQRGSGALMDFPAFTDLGALADELAKRGDVKLRALMTQAWRVQSCLGDIRQAIDCMDALTALVDRPKSEDTAARLATERALMTTIIMLYARATSTSTGKGERGSIQLDKDRLSASEWADHTAIVDVRNQAMAHVYTSRSLNDHDWHREKFFAVHIGDGVWKPASATNQTGYHQATADRLSRMLPVAQRELKAKFDKRMAAVSKMINDDVKGGALFKHVFDPVPVFGSEEGVRLVLGGAPQGESAFWINEGDRRAG